MDEHQFNGYLMPFDHQGGMQNLDSLTNRLRLVTVRITMTGSLASARSTSLSTRPSTSPRRAAKRASCRRQFSCSEFRTRLRCRLSNFRQTARSSSLCETAGSFSAADRERLRAAATDVIKKTVLPAYRKLDKYFNKKYLPAARDSIGLSASAERQRLV